MREGVRMIAEGMRSVRPPSVTGLKLDDDDVNWLVKHIAISAGGLDLFVGPVHDVANPSLRRFLGAVLSRRQVAEMDPATRYTLRRNIASTKKIWFFFHEIQKDDSLIPQQTEDEKSWNEGYVHMTLHFARNKKKTHIGEVCYNVTAHTSNSIRNEIALFPIFISVCKTERPW